MQVRPLPETPDRRDVPSAMADEGTNDTADRTDMKVVTLDARRVTGTALIASDDSVWVPVPLAWWNVAMILWWWLSPADRRAWTTVRHRRHGVETLVRTRVIRVATSHARIYKAPSK